MNIVKGVAGLIRRSSGGHASEGGSSVHGDESAVPSPRILFGNSGEEAVLNSLWQRYENAIDKVEKKKLLQHFLLQFIQTYENWEPAYNGQLPSEQTSGPDDIVIGCSAGHPSEVVLIIIQEIVLATSLLADLRNNSGQILDDPLEPAGDLDFSTDALQALNCVVILTRSMHNCKVFSYYGGVQKITALLKAAVVKLKTLTSALPLDEHLSSSSLERIEILQKILVYVVSIIFNFMELHTLGMEKAHLTENVAHLISRKTPCDVSSNDPKSCVSETRLVWQQKAIIMVMEAGGVNWLVELLRVIRRLNLNQQWTDLSLHCLTLGTLMAALCENPRAQNHFRSIGGLDVLLDGLGLPSSNFSFSKNVILDGDDRRGIFHLQLFSLEVLRESAFGNVNNMQFLCENGRIHKFANSICLPAFMLQEFCQRQANSTASDNPLLSSNYANCPEQIFPETLTHNNIHSSKLSEWNEYSVKLSRVLCSFLLTPEDTELHGHESIGQSSLSISLAYWELSIRWMMKALLTVFPCIKACTTENELPNHIRILANSLQHYILCTFRKVLLSAPVLLDIFREEGIWELIFSDKIFYFGSNLEEFKVEISEISSRSQMDNDLAKTAEVDILQVEAISFLEFVAALSENRNNSHECSVLLDTLERSACNPEIASIILKSLHRILHITSGQSVASFNSLDANSRILKVACIQFQALRKQKNSYHHSEDGMNKIDTEQGSQSAYMVEPAVSWFKCIESAFGIFTEYLLVTDNGRYLVLQNSNCIDNLFELFWEENLRKRVLEQILGLLKLPASSPEANRGQSQLCSKFLEIITQAKDRESGFAELSIELLTGIREIILIDQMHYQSLFHNGECFLHILSLLNGSLDESIGEQLLLNILQTLTLLLMGNADLKGSFRTLVGVGYQTLQSLILDFCKWDPKRALLDAILDMLVDGNFTTGESAVVKNEDVPILFLNVLQKSSNSLQHYGLDVLQNMLKDSITNRTACFRAGMLGFLLDWFTVENREDMITKIAQLIQIIGGHSISGKDIRKIFALLRTENTVFIQTHRSLLLTCIHFMLKEKGPEAFFEFSGCNSGIIVKSPVQWPNNKGFSFSCWLRLEDVPDDGTMGLFSFLTDTGKGCLALLAKDMLIFESISQRQQCIQLPLNLSPRKWHFLCITHSIGRAFSGGSQLRCYVDANLISSEKCRYSKVSEPMSRCTIGTDLKLTIDEPYPFNSRNAFPFLGQIGPLYAFSDALSPEQIKGLYSLGPSYMYSFVGDGLLLDSHNSLYSSILDAKDGLSSKIIFGLNAQASDGRTLFNVSCMHESYDKNAFQAVIMDGTKLCSRRLLQEIIYCVGGVSVFFPLLTQFDRSALDGELNQALVGTSMSENLAAKVIELVASVLDGNASNQQQMHLLSGFSILGFLLQSVPPTQLNADTLSSLKYMFYVLRSSGSGMSEMLIRDVILPIFMNPHIWVYASYAVQRDLYMFLIQYFESDRSLLSTSCGFPRIIHMICHFYWDKAGRSAFGNKPLLHPVTKEIIGERPNTEEVRKIRLLLLSLAEMSLRQKISPADVKTLAALFERSHDMICIEDVLQMVIRGLSHKPLLASFLEQTNFLGGCHIFVNLLQRESEPIRLLGLQFLGKLLVGPPSEKKGAKLFSITVGRSKSIAGNYRKLGTPPEPIFSAISERLFKFPLSDHLCATLFDVLLGGASPKQVLQKHNSLDAQRNKKSSTGLSSHFILPQILVCIFKYLETCQNSSMRLKILKDILNLLDSNPSNIEDLMEYGWMSWLETSVRLDVIKNYETVSKTKPDCLDFDEQILVKNLYCVVLSHYLYSVKGGWQQLEETVNFLLLNFKKEDVLHGHFLCDIFADLIGSLVDISTEENIFISQPCRDNALFLLKLVNELVIIESGNQLLFPILGISSEFPSEGLQLDNQKDICSAVTEALNLEGIQLPRILWTFKPISAEDGLWDLYDKTWILINALYGKGLSKMASKVSTSGGPSIGQRARGLVESLNIPGAEMAAVVVSGGISTALSGKTNKYIDKAMLLRGEKCPRVIFHLVILYLCKAGLESASRCVHQFITLLPLLFTSDDDPSRNRLHYFIWSLVNVRSKYGILDDGARFHIVTHLILEIVNFAKSMLATSILGRDDPIEDSSSSKESGFILGLLQRERVLAAAVDEVKSVSSVNADRLKQLQEFHVKLDEYYLAVVNYNKAFNEDIQSSLNAVLSSDDNRKARFQLAYDEEQQIVAEKWIHMFRALIDERGPWSSHPFPNSIIKRWKLDKTEDSWRRRPKHKRNYKFDNSICHPPTAKISSGTSQPANESSTGSKTSFPEQMKQILLKGVRGITEEKSPDGSDEELSDSDTKNSSENLTSEYAKGYSGQVDIVLDKETSSGSTDNDSSEVRLLLPSVLITPKRKLAGNLAVLQSVLHFSGEFLVVGTGGSSVFKSFKETENTDPGKAEQPGSIPKQKWNKGSIFDGNRGKGTPTDNEDPDAFIQQKSNKIKLHRRWNLSTIKAVYWTRYLLQYTAIEIFFNDSTAPVFVNFASPKDAKHVGTLIVSLRNEMLYPKGSFRDKSGLISFIDRRKAVEMAENARESWRRREISNFEYLMILNTLSGRSYNDLTQYPVFPWVLADYSSEKLDFNKSSTFRDLSKPVGALDSKRLEVFEDRYHNFCDPDIPSFYYGSHYSSMGIVLYYLLRLEPFTALHRNLQGGKFDHADRLFQTIDATYRNCLTNTSDVKELIPEFFYMPEFLVNSNSYHLGVKQDGEPLGDVGLPPWSKGSPEEFIQRNREALESEYVSSNLHQWIDLVFGYKQRGKPAVEAANVFYYLTYEGAVDMDNMDDMLQKSAIEDQIANFGQTPIQIFRKKHPRRGPPIPITHPLYFAPASITLTSIVSNIATPPSAIIFIDLLDSNIVLVNQRLTLSVKLWLTTQLQAGGNFTFSGSQEPFFGIGSDTLPPRKLGTQLAENIEFGRQCLATMHVLNESYLISCGNWENSFQVISLSDGRIAQSIRQHKDVVSCISVSSDGSILATGSYDTTVMVWHASRGRFTERRSRILQTDVPRKDHVIIESPFHILCGHDDIITCIFVSAELDMVISGSKDGTCIFHTLREGTYVHSIRHPSGSPLTKLVVSPHGRLVVYSENDLSLHMYTINGKHVASSESNGRLNCIELSSCGYFLVCAGDQGQIILRSMHSLDVVRKYDGVGKIVTSLAVTPEECFLAGTKDGSLLVYSIENPVIRRGTNFQRHTKSRNSLVTSQ